MSKSLWKSSIAKNLIGGFVVVLIPLVATHLYTNSLSMNMIRKEVTGSYSKSIQVLAGQLEGSLSKFENLTYALASDSDLNAINQAPHDTQDLWAYARQIRSLQLYSSTNDLEGEITIYLRNRDRQLSSKSGFQPIGNLGRKFAKGAALAPRTWFFRSKPEDRQTYLTFVRGSGAQWDNGVVASVDIGLSQFRPIIEGLQLQEHGTAFIFGPQAGDIYSVHAEMDMVPLQTVILSKEESKGNFPYTHNGTRYIVLFEKSPVSGLALGMLFPEKQIMEPINRIRAWMLAILAASLGLGLFYVFYAYRKLLVPVRVLVEAMNKLRFGQLKTRISSSPRNEFGFVYKQFNRMADQIDSLINEIYLERLNQQQAQLKLLQSQINPHFLYNCLNFIYQMSMGDNADGAAKMSLYLSKYFRYATKSETHYVSLWQELDNIGAYVQIQKMRYGGRIGYSVHVPDELLHTAIPRLTLQPIVENAFVHGIEAGDSVPRHISVHAAAEPPFIRITVENNGLSLPQEELERIQASLQTMGHEDYGYGLNNTHWRLVLRFGEGAGLQLENREPHGLKVHIRIPSS
jgi:two-component system sensor histidine kinase YesM